MNAIERSKCIVEAILSDLSANYRAVGGGGISRIEQNSSTSYSVLLPQEERIDVRTYEVEVSPTGRVTIVAVVETTKSP